MWDDDFSIQESIKDFGIVDSISLQKVYNMHCMWWKWLQHSRDSLRNEISDKRAGSDEYQAAIQTKKLKTRVLRVDDYILMFYNK